MEQVPDSPLLRWLDEARKAEIEMLKRASDEDGLLEVLAEIQAEKRRRKPRRPRPGYLRLVKK